MVNRLSMPSFVEGPTRIRETDSGPREPVRWNDQGVTRRAADGKVESAGKPQVINKMGVRGPVWTYKVGRN